jgi:hypothetical protein
LGAFLGREVFFFFFFFFFAFVELLHAVEQVTSSAISARLRRDQKTFQGVRVKDIAELFKDIAESPWRAFRCRGEQVRLCPIFDGRFFATTRKACRLRC